MARPETHPIKKIIGFTADMLDAVEGWRAKQMPVPNLSEAIRRLVEIGLAAGKPMARTPSKTAARAAELASQAIDRQSDPTAPAEERATRKRRILKGPSMARGIRKDR